MVELATATDTASVMHPQEDTAVETADAWASAVASAYAVADAVTLAQWYASSSLDSQEIIANAVACMHVSHASAGSCRHRLRGSCTWGRGVRGGGGLTAIALAGTAAAGNTPKQARCELGSCRVVQCCLMHAQEGVAPDSDVCGGAR